jgi:hypothetical protein
MPRKFLIIQNNLHRRWGYAGGYGIACCISQRIAVIQAGSKLLGSHQEAPFCSKRWYCAKSGKRGTDGEQHLQRYLSEFDFRANTREKFGINDVSRAEIALKGTKGKRLTYRTTCAASHS